MSNYNELLNIAKGILKNKKKGMPFNTLWKEVCKEGKINAKNSIDLTADFYQALMESSLFFYDSKTSEWGLRENIKFETFQKMSDAFRANADDDVKEKDYQNDMSQSEIIELENGSRNDKTSMLDLSDEKDDEILMDDIDDMLDDEE